MRISVAIPTYKRPEELRRAIVSVVTQDLKPFELIVISRENDLATNSVIDECSNQYLHINIRHEFVQDPGFLPPIWKAIDVAKGDVLALLDDDAEAHPDWLDRMAKYYKDPNVGGVGGRYINFFGGIKQEYAPVAVVGKLCWNGKPVGNMYCGTISQEPMSSDFLAGGNLSYRLSVFREAKPDPRLGRNVSFYWEMDVGIQVKRLGYKVIFDPQILVNHYSAPREIAGLRTVNYDGVYWSNYNYGLLMRKHLNLLRFLTYVTYSLCVGWSGSPGFFYVLVMLFRPLRVQWRNMVFASILGRITGVCAKNASSR